MFGGNTPKGTPSLFIPYIDDTSREKDHFQTITALPAYQKMSLEVRLFCHAQEVTNAKYLQELRLEDYALGRKQTMLLNLGGGK
jgi:hypothetical protein